MWAPGFLFCFIIYFWCSHCPRFVQWTSLQSGFVSLWQVSVHCSLALSSFLVKMFKVREVNQRIQISLSLCFSNEKKNNNEEWIFYREASPFQVLTRCQDWERGEYLYNGENCRYQLNQWINLNITNNEGRSASFAPDRSPWEKRLLLWCSC